MTPHGIYSLIQESSRQCAPDCVNIHCETPQVPWVLRRLRYGFYNPLKLYLEAKSPPRPLRSLKGKGLLGGITQRFWPGGTSFPCILQRKKVTQSPPHQVHIVQTGKPPSTETRSRRRCAFRCHSSNGPLRQHYLLAKRGASKHMVALKMKWSVFTAVR